MNNYQRLKNYFLIFVLLFTVLGSSYVFMSTVYDLQFTNSDYFKNQALSYRVKTEKIKASRGSIYDKNLLVLSSSSRSYNVGIFPKKIDNLDEVLNLQSAILFIERDVLQKRIVSTSNFFYLDGLLMGKSYRNPLFHKIVLFQINLNFYSLFPQYL